ncbi:NADP-dependent oxidoreductase domain-containing protein [Pelagophyceae sp. CCMP2097]|nr:NADP-dependent oxidoreductase domain-containing protein [Pelagophyceae sp. CCMP2097]
MPPRASKRQKAAADAAAPPATEAAPRVALANAEGVSMPVFGLGTWKSEVGKTGAAVEAAIRAGYRLIDCANDYGNEKEIGETLTKLFAEGVVTREDLFIQAKLWNSNHKPDHVRLDLAATLKDLQIDYVDNFVIHWPMACPSSGLAAALDEHGAFPAPKEKGSMFPLEENGMYCSDNDSHFVETWHVMEQLVEEKLCKAIGLSNFNKKQVAEVVACATLHKPATLQNECHAFLQQKDLVDYCKSEGIAFQAYSPLGSADRPWAKTGSLTSGPPAGGHELLEHPAILKVAKRLKKSAAQVVLRWHFQRDVCTVAKSVTPARISANIQFFDFELTPADMAIFDGMNVGWRHLLWPETAMHPDYPFKDDLPSGYVPTAPADGATRKDERAK